MVAVADPIDNRTSGPSRRSLYAALALVAWVLVLVFGWALQPIEDTVPVVVDPTSELAAVLAENPALTPDDAPRAQLVECNTLFDTAPRDLSEPLPELRTDYVYDRTPCESPHAGARLAAVVNALAVVVMVAGWVWIARRTQPDPVAAEPTIAA